MPIPPYCESSSERLFSNKLEQSVTDLGCAGPLARHSCCLDFHGVDVRHATCSALKDITDIKVLKSRRSNERHNLSAASATRRSWRVFTRMFVAHGGQRSLNRKCPPTPDQDVFGRVNKSLRVQDN